METWDPKEMNALTAFQTQNCPSLGNSERLDLNRVPGCFQLNSCLHQD